MFGIGSGELLLVLIIALIVLGPERMPKLARDLGRALAEFRKTSDELRNEFLNADTYVDTKVSSGSATAPAIAAPAAPAEPAEPAELPVTEAAVATGVPLEPDETLFDREAREARERLRDPERMARAKTEGWAVPTDDAGTSDRSG